MTAPGSALEVSGITAAHGHGSRLRQTLAETSFEVAAGESLAVVGVSGAGKSTLADVVLGLRPPTAGWVRVQGADWATPGQRPARRRRHLVQGVPQDPAAAFVPSWTIRRSIRKAARLLCPGQDAEDLIGRAAGLAHLDPELLDRRPLEMSGGQAQRAAIARALAVRPAVLVADEPTSALDPGTAQSVATALLSCASQSGTALLLVTHDPALAGRCDRTITIVAAEAAL